MTRYTVACSVCGEPVIGVVTRRGRRRRFCSEACRAKAVLQWKSRNRIKNSRRESRPAAAASWPVKAQCDLRCDLRKFAQPPRGINLAPPGAGAISPKNFR